MEPNEMSVPPRPEDFPPYEIDDDMMENGVDATTTPRITRRRAGQNKIVKKKLVLEPLTPRSTESVSNLKRMKISERLERHPPASNLSAIDQLKEAVRCGSILNMGKAVYQGYENETLTDVELEEYCKVTLRPIILGSQHFKALKENLTEEQRNWMDMGHFVMAKLIGTDEQRVLEVEASIASISATTGIQYDLKSITKEHLHRSYKTDAIDHVPGVDLTVLYNNISLIKAPAKGQLSQFYTLVLATMFDPPYKVWKFTYRPNSSGKADKNFTDLPLAFMNQLFGLSWDICDYYLPKDLLVGSEDTIDETHPFLESLDCSEPIDEIMRRREGRENAKSVFKSAFSRALKSVRAYHYDLVTNTLKYCEERNTCKDHLSWNQVRHFPKLSKKTKAECNSATPSQILDFYHRSPFFGNAQEPEDIKDSAEMANSSQ
ncbi:uncharacterized protein CELE_K09F6.15 [Caenorhabditis elegans]|uniref:Uncharacterized protein n=1 Tax=Caenorhabditis elegans TaxID=6239 RepID=A0A238UMP6_CAEEL|nr:Uncharacterized protein CELE_K09F6.15 [Caenorhabditis elegans]SNR22533.1 Uncharacterized protein CELE_K09F6.15 [Caenorhabditis elegans]|eukprot:NP_001342022.1 Uncharacterized protein CELE_K09F6.15 [Caenorhabditis elegans]